MKTKPVSKVNLYVFPVSMSNRKSCPSCMVKLGADNCIVSVGYYRNAKYRCLFYACSHCMDRELNTQVHTDQITIRYRSGYSSIPWVEQFKEENAIESD